MNLLYKIIIKKVFNTQSFKAESLMEKYSMSFLLYIYYIIYIYQNKKSPLGNVLHHIYIELKNTFLFFSNYFNTLQNVLQCVTHYKSCRKISKYFCLFKSKSV